MLVRITSHRAFDKLLRYIPRNKILGLYNLHEGYFYEIPDDFDFSHIKGIKECKRKPKYELLKAWTAEDMGIKR